MWYVLLINVKYFTILFTFEFSTKITNMGENDINTKRCHQCLLKSNAADKLNFSELEELDESCVQVTFKNSETIFKQGALSSNIIYLSSGLVKIVIDGPNREQILKVIKAPCYLGIPTTVGDKVNHYSAIALEETTACFVDVSTFKNFIKLNSDFAYEVILDLCKNELDQFNRCVNLVQLQMHGRMAKQLLFFADEIYNSDEYVLPLNRNDFANLLCSSREIVSKILSEFNSEGIIALEGKKIKILDKEKLRFIFQNG